MARPSTINISGRRVIIHNGSNNGKPVILCLHPGYNSAWSFQWQTLLHQYKDYTVVFPEGRPLTGNPEHNFWMDGRIYYSTTQQQIEEDKNELEFFQSLIEQLSVNRGPLFATGFSNGGRMCYHLLNSGIKFDAIAPYGCKYHPASSRYQNLIKNPTTKIFHHHGEEDTLQPLRGHVSRSTAFQPLYIPSLVRCINDWIAYYRDQHNQRRRFSDILFLNKKHSNWEDTIYVSLYPNDGHKWPEHLSETIIGQFNDFAR